MSVLRTLWRPIACFCRFAGDLAVAVDGAVEGGFGFFALGWGDIALAIAPEEVDRFDAPQGAIARGADRFLGDEHVDGVGV